MVHADLKPANLVIVDGSIKIIDFGISMQCGANTTAIHRDDNTGTVNYMSPEAIANNGVLATSGLLLSFYCRCHATSRWGETTCASVTCFCVVWNRYALCYTCVRVGFEWRLHCQLYDVAAFGWLQTVDW